MIVLTNIKETTGEFKLMEDLTEPIDLRSDTVTQPSVEMRSAMAVAPVGDDQFAEDPTVNRLQERAATLLGKEATLWMPTGTMANQVALRLFTQPGRCHCKPREQCGLA